MGSQCSQTPPTSTRATADPLWCGRLWSVCAMQWPPGTSTASTSGRVANSGVGRRMGCARPWFSRFVNLRETEAEREQPVLLADGPRARKAKALAQPQHGFEALDGAPGRVEGLEAAHPRHGPLDPEVVTLDPLLQVLGDVMHRGARQEPVFPGCRDGGRIGPRTIGADPVRGEQRLLLQRLAEEALGR